MRDTQSIRTTLLRALVPCAFCLSLNVAGAYVADILGLPLFLDCVGTITAAITGGSIPGILVGYATNLIDSVFDDIAIFYGAVSVLIGAMVVEFTNLGWLDHPLKRPHKLLLAIMVLAVVSGGSSFLLTVNLFGLSGGETLATQFSSDILSDLLDKSVELVVALVVVRLLPSSFSDAISPSLWQQKPLSRQEMREARHLRLRFTSIRTKLICVIFVIIGAVGLVTSFISFFWFNRSMEDEQAKHAYSIASLAAEAIDANLVNTYLSEGEDVEGYRDTEASLAQIRDDFDDVEYIYVYQIRDDGCHVVLDPDTATEPGSDLGEVIPFDKAFSDQIGSLLAGKAVEPVISNETYGWLLSVYQPLYDDSGTCVAYVAVDINMDHVRADGYAFLARSIALCLAFFILIYFVVLWLSDYGIIFPLNGMSLAASGFAYDSETSRDGAVERVRELNVHTGDEIENLYHAMLKTVEDSVRYIEDAEQQAATIERMQSNLIMVMADLVESRDQYTGAHIRKTAAYVQVIMDQMRKEGIYADRLTDDFVYDVAHSAPLHDIGKIAVPDSILNKPGRLTDEEFKVMQSHTVVGAEILANAVDAMSDPAYLDEARRLAVAHHEKWNGTGYPYGLSGEEIPLSARIMAVADVFDALVSKRSYKEGFPIEKALDIIREGMGSHFDPLVAQAFLDAEEEVRKIASDYGDDQGTQLIDGHDA